MIVRGDVGSWGTPSCPTSTPVSSGSSPRGSRAVRDVLRQVADRAPEAQPCARGGAGDATAPAWNCYLLTIECPCGVVFGRWITPEDAERDLLPLRGIELGGGRASESPSSWGAQMLGGCTVLVAFIATPAFRHPLELTRFRGE